MFDDSLTRFFFGLYKVPPEEYIYAGAEIFRFMRTFPDLAPCEWRALATDSGGFDQPHASADRLARLA
jgi:hypothetical protein